MMTDDREPRTQWSGEPMTAPIIAREELLGLLEKHVDGVRHYLHLQIGKPLSKDLISAPEIALDNLRRALAEAIPDPAQTAWQPISDLPETDPKFLGKGTNVLMFSPKFGIRTGEAFNAHGRKWANVGNLHGNAIDDWGATHWMHLPAEPSTLPSTGLPAPAPDEADFYLVPREIIDQFPEININNYDHDDACALNTWGCHVVTSANPAPSSSLPAPAPHAEVREATIEECAKIADRWVKSKNLHEHLAATDIARLIRALPQQDRSGK